MSSNTINGNSSIKNYIINSPSTNIIRYLIVALGIIVLLGSLAANGYFYSSLTYSSFAFSGFGLIFCTFCLVISKWIHKEKKAFFVKDPVIQMEHNFSLNNSQLKVRSDQNIGLSPNELLIPFYTENGKDICGRTFDEILAWNDQVLEEQHDYIQWLFPNIVASNFNATAPTLNDEIIAHLKGDLRAQEKLTQAFLRMAKFYGFHYCPKTNTLTELNREAHQICVLNWTTNTHNHLRFTRIFNFLCLMGRQDLARLLFIELEKIYLTPPDYITPIPAMSYEIWKKAAKIEL